MKIGIACDHAGFPAKEVIIETVKELGHEVIDFGTHSKKSVDYPDFAQKLGKAIQEETVERGILVCGSGVGACIAVNKMRGIFAGLCHDTYSARQGVEHDDMNVLCLGARIVGPELLKELVRAFLSATFSREERHVRRTQKIHLIEENQRK